MKMGEELTRLKIFDIKKNRTSRFFLFINMVAYSYKLFT